LKVTCSILIRKGHCNSNCTVGWKRRGAFRNKEKEKEKGKYNTTRKYSSGSLLHDENLLGVFSGAMRLEKDGSPSIVPYHPTHSHNNGLVLAIIAQELRPLSPYHTTYYHSTDLLPVG
jgi:hypothetical protein